VTPADVAKVALLARLDFSPDELAALTTQLTSIVEYVAQLQALDTSCVEPMAHGVELENAMADDIVAPSLPRTEVLRNAPKQDGEYYLVPAVLGE
jgi:aspartyl-tRNA(Asn)/glutamyl-tRNA(Gln) amidotransferase subunit C